MRLAFREGLAIWPSTFFLFIISAAAVGPSFVLLTTWLVEKITKKHGRQLVCNNEDCGYSRSEKVPETAA